MKIVFVLMAALVCGCPEKKEAASTKQPVVSDGVREGRNTGNASPVIDCAKACRRVHECEPSEPYDECFSTCESIGAGLECAEAAANCEEYKKCLP